MKDNYIIVPSNHGGPRENAGRKPVSDKKIQINLMIRGSEVTKHGGKKKVQAILLDLWDKYLDMENATES